MPIDDIDGNMTFCSKDIQVLWIIWTNVVKPIVNHAITRFVFAEFLKPQAGMVKWFIATLPRFLTITLWQTTYIEHGNMVIEIVDLPIVSMVIFHSYVSLPEGTVSQNLSSLSKRI